MEKTLKSIHGLREPLITDLESIHAEVGVGNRTLKRKGT